MKLLTRERQNWNRVRSHTVVFDRDPLFRRFRNDPSGSVMRILHLWLADKASKPEEAKAYLGSIRFCGGWWSKRELLRLYRRATHSAVLAGESRRTFRRRLSRFLRRYFKM